MKIILICSIMMGCFIFGYIYKENYKNKYYFLIYISGFTNYLKSNINLFKVNLVKIIDDYKLLQDIKNAKYNEIFIKNGEIYQINQDFLNHIGLSIQDNSIIKTFLCSIGTNDYYFEDNKINTFLQFLDKKLEEYSTYIKTKGELTLKIAIAIGCVISIILW